MFSFFLKGGPVMWPLLITSIITITVVVERLLFLLHERAMRQPKIVENIFTEVEAGNIEKAILLGGQSKDFVVNTLVFGLRHRDHALSNALMQAANTELQRFSQGLPILDTVITLAPSLGIFSFIRLYCPHS